MNGADVIAIIILAAIVIAVAAYLLHWLYRRSTKDVSFVRTGFGGEKVVMGGGALVLPILHDITEVNMNTLRLEVTRAREKSLITKDRMRVELTVEFYVRVSPTMRPWQRRQGPGQPDDECRTVERPDPGPVRRCDGRGGGQDVAREYPRKPSAFVREVKQEVAESLALDGLELETVSLTSLDQTDIKLFDPSNTFDAEGLTRLTEQIESRKKKRNDIEKDTAVAIRAKNLEAEKRCLEIPRDSEYARLAHEAEVAVERVREHSARVYRLAYRLTGNPHDAEDLTQEVFVRVFRSLSTYTPGTFEGWLHRITTNLFLDQARRKQRIRFDALADDAAERLPEPRAPPDAGASTTHTSTPTCRQALDALPPEFRAAVVLCDIEGLSYEEIAATLGVKLGTVRSRIHRGRAQLRKALEHRGPRRRTRRVRQSPRRRRYDALGGTPHGSGRRRARPRRARQAP